MSEEKKRQLIAEGKYWPDGTIKETCPMCQRPFPQGEHMPVPEGGVVAEAETITAEAAAPGQEG